MKKIRLLLLEDNRLLRNGIIAMLKSQVDINIIAASGNGENTVIMLRKLKPDVIILDLGLQSQNSLTIVEIVKKDFPNAKVIMMDFAPVRGDINQYVKAGASGFILKDTTLDDFLLTIRTVAKGTNVLPPYLTNSLFTQIVEHALKDGKTKLRDAVRMTKREREVIELIVEGLSNREIGQKLKVSTYTIKSHIHNIMEKLALHTRLEIANYSYNNRTLKTIADNITTV
ncbi:MAG: response regulator transcription factor [Ignavibacteriaceae bacterium]|jgi:DNA-binding NarL/FixJ family response regulator